MLRKPATTTPKQFQTTWCFGKDWRHAGGATETFGSPNLYTFPTPKMGIKQIEQFSNIILRILRFLAESSGVTKLELFQPLPNCK